MTFTHVKILIMKDMENTVRVTSMLEAGAHGPRNFVHDGHG